MALREGRLVFDGPPEQLTEEGLDRIYAGDPYGTGASPLEGGEDTLHRRHDPVRISEGQDGISAH